MKTNVGLKTNQIRILIGIGLVLVILISFFFLTRSDKRSAINQIRVDIAGAIEKPGIYQIDEGSIVEDLIAKAGGLKSNVNKKRLAQNINRAQSLEDGDKIYIPIKGETIGPSRIGGEVKINLNTATAEELELLPGVGAMTAARIISYRREIGGFKKIEDVLGVQYMTVETFNSFKDLVEI
jgi:competence protein ComEA